jgi:membrane protease YdiL (CAAX protease family)
MIGNDASTAQHRAQSVPRRTRRRDLFELGGIYALILIVIWTPRPWQAFLWVIAAATILYIAYLSFEGFTPMGLCTRNLMRSLWVVAFAMVLALGAVTLAVRFHTLHLPETPLLFLRHYGLYALWAAIQQIILQCFFLSRALRLLSDSASAAALTSGLFAVAHLPNPILTIITLFFGFAACYFYLYYRNLVPLALAHAILGISIAITIPGSVDHNMRVGISYLTYVDRTAMTGTVLSTQPHRPD